jgi:hypothetical protein
VSTSDDHAVTVGHAVEPDRAGCQACAGRADRYNTLEALEGSGLEPYQVTHAISLFSNANTGLLAAHGADMTTLLPTEPRLVHDLIVKAVEAGGYRSQSVTSRSITTRSRPRSATTDAVDA